MKRNRFFLLIMLLLCLTAWHQVQAQTAMVCNDLVFISMDEDCIVTVKSEMILEGGPYCCYDDYIVEFDKIAPYGNGPWVTGDLTQEDIGKTYQVRVTDPFTGNKCWGNIKAEDKLPPKLICTGLTTLNLAANGSVTLAANAVQVTSTDGCSDPGDITLKLANNQTSVTYNCSKLGINSLLVTATDAIGNTSSCQTTVLVADPLNACVGGCATVCPPSQIVTYEQGINVLLPAFQNDDFSPFDVYGTAEFDVSCLPADTTYVVTYHPSAIGQSWFLRRWDILPGGVPFGNCQQTIVFPSTSVFNVSGKVFIDSLLNCVVDAGEVGTDAFNVVVKKMPGGQTFTVKPLADGSYSLDLEITPLDSVIEVRIDLPNGIVTACPTFMAIPANTSISQQVIDFGLYSEVQCPLTEVSISNYQLRRCFANNTYWVKYCNVGFQPAEDAYVTVEFDSLIAVNAASIPYTQNGNLYTFQLGDLPRFTCNTFTIQTTVSCETVLGQTLCSEATIYPHELCNEAAWEGPKVEARAICLGDSVSLQVHNVGTQDMTEMLDFIVVEDILMRGSGKFSLKAGDFTSLKMPANGSTWRIEADQVTGYPEIDWPSAFLEACGGIVTPGLVNAFALNDDPLYRDMDCTEVIGSYDPNDKSATPTGYGTDHIIRANTDLEYKIRFQNTGTDTAFTVVVVDTLSQFLDYATFESGVSSHNYRLDVQEGGILRFVFPNILLPDSNVNEAASHGFVTYRIAQKPDLPIGTVIKNEAAIYFDFNDPVITNTVFHTIGAPYVIVSTHQPYLPNVSVEVRPNPFSNQAVLEVKGREIRDGLLRLYDAQGREVQTQIFQGNQCKIERNHLLNGVYFFQILDQGVPVSSGNLQVH